MGDAEEISVGSGRHSPPSPVNVAPGVDLPKAALRFSYVASRGPGGQNVNKRATCAQLRLAVDDIPITPGAKGRLRRLAGSRLAGDDTITLVADEHRSQRRNRDECLERLRELLVKAMHRPKPRRATKPSVGSVRRRLDEKRQRGEVKRKRRPPGAEGA